MMKKHFSFLLLFLLIGAKSIHGYSDLEDLKDNILLAIAQGDETTYLESLNTLEELPGISDTDKATLVLSLLSLPGVQTPPIILDFSHGLAEALNIPLVEAGNVFTSIKTDSITEYTVGHGTTINSISIKANALNNLAITNGTFGGANYISLTPTTANTALNVDPTGTGYLSANVPDGTAVGGNARGANSVDWSMNRLVATSVASGQYSTVSGGDQNTASGIESTVGGGGGNVVSGGQAGTISGGNGNIATGNYCTVGGGQENSSTGAFSSTVGGGHFNTASAQYSTISGGYQNTAAAQASWIGGGNTNQVLANSVESGIGCGDFNTIYTYASDSFIGGGLTNSITSTQSFIGGGTTNIITGSNSTIGGGVSNTITGTQAFIGGGQLNQAGGVWSVIGGGESNQVSANLSVVAGGFNNNNTHSQSFIGGGASNQLTGGSAFGFSVIGGGSLNSIASCNECTIAGGFDNTILSSSLAGTIGGGTGNLLSGQYATIPGGTGNRATGNYSFAAGTRAQATGQGTFVLTDSQNADYVTTGTDQMVLRFQNGVGINRLSPSQALDVVGNIIATGTITGSSDIRLKKNIHYFDATDNILEKVMQLKPCQFDWNDRFPSKKDFMKEGEEIHQIGFIANEVEDLFPELITLWSFDHRAEFLAKHPDLRAEDMEEDLVNDYRALDYARMVSLLCRAIQELKMDLNGTKLEFREALAALREEFVTKNS